MKEIGFIGIVCGLLRAQSDQIICKETGDR